MGNSGNITKEYGWHIRLRQMMDDYFDENEIRVVCFDLQIQYENIRGDTKKEKIIGVIRHCAKTKQLQELINACSKERPEAPWIQIIEEANKAPMLATKQNWNTAQVIELSQSHPSNRLRWLLTIAVIGIGLILSYFIIPALKNNENTDTSLGVTSVIGTVAPPPTKTPPTSLATHTPLPPIKSYTVMLSKTIATSSMTYELNYLQVETGRLMIHMTVSNKGENSLRSCGQPTITKLGYGRISWGSIIETGGFFNKGSGSYPCLVPALLVGSMEKLDGWVVYRIDTTKFISTGLYTIEDVITMPLTTFELK